MAIQDDFTIDVVNKRITYDTAFVDDRPPNIYTVNELYSYLQDTFDEPGYMQYSIPMSAQTPTQYSLINQWFIDDESMKALYGGSIQSLDWTKSGAVGITALRYASATVAPDSTDIGKDVTGDTSGATGVILAVDTTRSVVWVRNTSATQFVGNEVVDDDTSGTDPDFTTETNNGVLSGESIWSNLFSVGSLQANSEIYVGQEDDFMGGNVFHDATANGRLRRRIEKVDEWWDADVDFTSSPNLLGGAGHFDILVKTQEAGNLIDGGRLAIFLRQFSKVYSHFELVGGAQNLVVPFSSGSADLNAQDGPYTVPFDGRAGTDMAVGDILENGTTTPVGRLRAVVTSVTGGGSATGTIEYYLIGDTEAVGNERTLIQLANNDNLVTRGSSTNDFEVNGSPTSTGPALADPGAGTVTITFGDAQFDVDEDSTDEEYGCVINCANNLLADVYKRVMFLISRGNQDGTSADTQDTLLPSALSATNEAGEFFRALGDVVVTWDARVGTGLTEGELVQGSISSATGVVVSANELTNGTAVLTAVKGTFVDNDVVSEIDDGATNTVTLDAAPSSIVDNTAAPFGTFAGGRWFLSQGIYLQNVPTADANNWETVDLAGSQRVPPTVRTITFAGLTANDRASIFEVDTAGGDDITNNQNGVGGAGASVGAATIPLDSTIALDVPLTGWVRIVDTSDTTGQEYRLAYSAVSGTTVTLDQGAWSTGTTTSAGTATVLNDTGAFTNFGGEGEIRTGMLIRNDAQTEWATVLRKIDNNSIETTPLTGAATWGNAEAWTANAPVVALVDADTAYFPFVDDVATGTSIAKLIKYVEDTDCIARARFSDPDVGGTRILPFQQTNITITDANLTVTAIRTTDSIAS